MKFCFSNKSMHPQDKYEAWIRRRAEWWARRRMTKSSEDVWQIRRCVALVRFLVAAVRLAILTRPRSEPISNYPPKVDDETLKNYQGPTLS